MRKTIAAKNYCRNNWPTSHELFVGWFLNRNIREPVNWKLTGYASSVGDKVKCSSNLTLFVHVLLPDKDMGQVDDWGTEFVCFFRFIDWWTGINKRTLHYHFLILCQVIILFFPPVFILHLLCSSLISFCHAVAFLLYLASILGSMMKWRQVTPAKNIQDHGKKQNNPPCPPSSCSFCLPLPQRTFKHVQVSMHMHACRHTRMHVHTHANTLVVATHFI